MRLPDRRVSDVENKLRVLLSVEALQMATRDQLWPFMARLDLMDYVPMCVYVDELRATGALSVGEHALANVMMITDTGREYLRFFASRMPDADRRRIRAEAPAYARELRERRQIASAYELAPPGEYRVTCSVREGDVPTLVLRVFTRDRALAARAESGFERAASALMTALYALDADDDAPAHSCYPTLQTALDAAAPDRPALCAYGKHEHGAVAWLTDARARYEVALLMPSRDAADRWAGAARAQSARLGKTVTDALKSAGGDA